jgi:cytoskeleton protein RodZ
MDDTSSAPAAEGRHEGGSAGAVLRAARERQGMHIATLAAAIKVSPKKLEALEHDRWDELPGPTFTRALAQAVCRALKTDPQAVMDLLPPADTSMLDSTFGTINEPFSGTGREPGLRGWVPSAPWLIAAVVLLLAAVAVVWMPAGTLGRLASGGASGGATGSAPAATESSSTTTVVPMPATASPGVATAPAAPSGLPAAPAATPANTPSATAAATAATAASAAFAATARALTGPTSPASPTAAASPSAPAAVPPGALVLSASGRSWIEVVDARGRVLVSRNLEAGESLGLDGLTPLQVVVGNATATQVAYKGQPVDLSSRARDNVARFELK